MDRRNVTYLLAAGIALLLIAATLYLTFQPASPVALPIAPTPTFPPLPAIDVAPPSSLVDLAEQYPDLAPILTDPELGSIYKEFLLVYEEEGEGAALELARQRGLLTAEGDVRVTLVLDTEENEPLVAQLEAVGVTVASAYRDRVNVAVPLQRIKAQLQSDEPGAIFAQLTELEHVIAVRLPERRAPDGSVIEGEGMSIIGAGEWHQAGFTGAGLRIGILDLGFAGYHDLLGVELPDEATVATFGWFDDREEHGAACAEIVHEIAPDAELFFAWYDGSDAAMGEAVDWLAAQGLDIISHSAGGLIGPRDGSGWDVQLVDGLAAQGILWVNSAGNQAKAHYRGMFTDEDGDGLHEFAPGEEMLALYDAGCVEIALSWEDDWEKAAQDYELFLYDEAGDELASSKDTQSGEAGQEPVEWIMYETDGETIYAAVTAYDTNESVWLDIFVDDAEVAHPSPAHSVSPPGDAVGSLTVGAVNWRDDTLASYSSQGPTLDRRLKPEISAPTGVSGATYGTEEFHGTSASAPHVAGAAALVWQARSDFTRQEVVDFLLAHVVDLGPKGPDTGYGYGRLQLPAPSAVNSAPTAAATATPMPTASLTEAASTPPSAPSATPAPLPTPTPVVYVTPSPPPAGRAGLFSFTSMGLIVGGLGCAGVGLLLGGVGGILFLTQRAQQVRQPAPVPLFEPSAPPQPRSVRCTACGTAARPGARFCRACGRSLAPDRRPRYCRHCGARLREESRFCPRCGQSVR
jgi:subtilisin family serine protease